MPTAEGDMDHATTIRRLYDLINTGNIDGFGRQLADDFAEHEDLPDFPPTKAGVLQYFQMLIAAFPDLRMVPEDVIVSGDKAVARVRVRVRTRARSREYLRPADGLRCNSSTSFVLAMTGGRRSTGEWSTSSR